MQRLPFDPLFPLPLVNAGLPGIGGRIKSTPEDFEVEEIPAYQPGGTGGFLYLWLEKRALGAEFFVRQIARRLGIAPGEVGTAGLKDRQAVTRQMVSVPAECESRLSALEGEGIRILSVSRHTNKLKAGHLHGNRFRILMRDVEPEAPNRLPALLDRLRQEGLLNYYGPQRFGRDGETVHLGLALLRREPIPDGLPQRPGAFLRRLALSAAQSALFNHCLAQRAVDGLAHRVLAGDVMARWPHGGMFVAQDLAIEQQRLERREIVPAGPMFGSKLFRAAEDAAAREKETLHAAALTEASFSGFGKLLAGTRRHNLVYCDDLSYCWESEGVRLSFTLPAGTYATVLLSEIMQLLPASLDDDMS